MAITMGHNATKTAVNYYLRYLMDFNLVQTKATQLTFEPINVSQFLEQELFIFFDDLTAKKIVVTPKITPNLTLTTNKLLLQRIIQNIVGNWLKYADKTATVSLKQRDEQHLALVFSNQTTLTAVPNKPVTQQFFTTAAADTQSTGLGLTIVQSLITTLGGKMQVETTTNCFTISLVLRTQPPVD
ncbi:sensor histidine kinase [Lactiplantibacillus daowaiensis]|uniref:Sensor histidine kinase n=1 Tax=Lactiplantibacillus daowaiensis TaxID=2559918 RepID=A0ABW1S2Z6_9LACO